MELLSTLLIDDEQLALMDIADALDDIGMFDVKGSFLSIADARQFLIKKKVTIDIIFCDIQMPDCSGLEAVQLLRPYCQYLVFCTGYDQYAMEAHHLLVDGYLLKPIDQPKVMELTDKLLKKSFPKDDTHYAVDHFLLADLPEMTKQDDHDKEVKNNSRGEKSWKRVEVKDIAFIKRAGNYLHFYGLQNRRDPVLLGVINWDMNKLYAKYSALTQLFPINQSIIVNEQFITKVMKDGLTVGNSYFSITKIGQPYIERYLAKVVPNYSKASN